MTFNLAEEVSFLEITIQSFFEVWSIEVEIIWWYSDLYFWPEIKSVFVNKRNLIGRTQFKKKKAKAKEILKYFIMWPNIINLQTSFMLYFYLLISTRYFNLKFHFSKTNFDWLIYKHCGHTSVTPFLLVTNPFGVVIQFKLIKSLFSTRNFGYSV